MMPLFPWRRPSPGPSGPPLPGAPPPGPGPLSPERIQADLDALGRGEIPAAAAERLRQQAGRELPWSSSLSVNDWALSRRLGFTPLGQVMGSSIYHTGWAYASTWSSGELAAPTQAAHAVRELAIGRMGQEAALLGAHGVVDVRLTRRAYAWGANLTEFTAVGTAVRVDGAPPAARPFLATVDGADFVKLMGAGYVPLGVALGVSVVYLYTNWQAQWQEQSWVNQEMRQFTEATYAVRSFAMQRLQRDAAQMGADGVMGYHTEMRVEKVEAGGGGADNERTDHILEFSCLGTAVGRMRTEGEAPRPVRTLLLDDADTTEEVP